MGEWRIEENGERLDHSFPWATEKQSHRKIIRNGNETELQYSNTNMI